MEKSVFEVITAYGINEGVNSVLLDSDEYKKIQAKIDSLTEEFDKLNLSEEQRLIVDRLISIYIENAAYYGKMTYRQGMRDCTSLLVELGLIKNGKEEDYTKG